ncbi:hypothetical protein NW767_015148 [Fusarium falciforme]|nr:hypothetical protein NW767_015148 [Fusarium falciforme]
MAMVPVDGMDESLSGIVHRHGKSIVTQLLEIQGYKLEEPESVAFIRNLECFKYVPNSNRKRRRSDGSAQARDQPRGFLDRWEIDAHEKSNYVALSYTWGPSGNEAETSGSYEVQTRESYYSGDRPQYYPSTVRDCIFSRITKYMRHKNIKLLWIDKHSVHQRNIQKKQIGVQAMHLVYSYSQHPVAMLARQVNSSLELNLLHKLLDGQLVQDIETGVAGTKQWLPVLLKRTSRQEALMTLQMLGEMMKDKWWTRAWTFQECYRAGVFMTLLIPLDTRLNRQKQSYPLFGDVPGELCVNAVDLSDQATRLCLALQEEPRGTLSEDEIETIQHISSTAGKYTQLLKGSDPMFPVIIADIAKRGITYPWDRLAIAANCCYYPTRLDALKLKDKFHSLSLSTLALCLLNGEILNNGKYREHTQELLDCNVSQYLQRGFYDRFRSPREARSLTFNRGCRFPDVSLTHAGIKTKGHLWKLGPLIDSSMFHNLPSFDEGQCVWLQPEEHRRLHQLVGLLRRESMTAALGDEVEHLLYVDSRLESEDDFENLSFSKRYLLRMAVELISAVNDGGKLRLGAIWDPSESSAEAKPYSALFVWDRNSCGRSEQGARGKLSEFVFTAIRPLKHNTLEQRAKDVDRHASLEVEMDDLPHAPGTGGHIPRLYVKSWLLGLCFFYECKRNQVVFPWPPELEKFEG